jgi:hypothetical protein
MAKGRKPTKAVTEKKTNENEELEMINDVSNTPLEVVTEKEEVVVEAVVEETVVEETVVEEVKATKKVKETKVEEKEAVVEIKEPKKVKELTIQEKFEESIAKTPFTLYQNGVLVCTHNRFLVIKTNAKYFEINNKKYTYTGLDIKY